LDDDSDWPPRRVHLGLQAGYWRSMCNPRLGTGRYSRHWWPSSNLPPTKWRM